MIRSAATALVFNPHTPHPMNTPETTPRLKCCRCKHKHTAADRVLISNKGGILSSLTCPRCGAKSYTKEK